MMNITGFLTSFFSWSVLIFASALCFAPMKSHTKKPWGEVMLSTELMVILMILVMSWIEASFNLTYNTLFLPMVIISFIWYHHNLKVHISKSLGIFITVCAFNSFICNFANGFDAWLHPTSNLNNFSLTAAMFQSVLCMFFSVPVLYLYLKYGSRLVDNMDIHNVWYMAVMIAAVFLGYNLLIAPRKYETVHINNAFVFFWLSLVLLLILMMLLFIMFYHIVNGMHQAEKTRERNRFLEMQESQYVKQQRYIEETARARHDFRQVLRTLYGMADEGDSGAILEYLDEYTKTLPQTGLTVFTRNHAVNSILGYYKQLAESSKIRTDWDIDLPASIPVSDIDLCTIIGNTLENAVIACNDVDENERFIDLSIRCEDSELYIVISNSFDGYVKLRKGHYLSTRKNGTGIGLSSIASIAEKCGGKARFSHDNKEFYSDVILPL